MYSDQENSTDVQENHESPMDKMLETVFDHFQQAYNTNVSEKMEQEHLSEDDAKDISLQQSTYIEKCPNHYKKNN